MLLALSDRAGQLCCLFGVCAEAVLTDVSLLVAVREDNDSMKPTLPLIGTGMGSLGSLASSASGRSSWATVSMSSASRARRNWQRAMQVRVHVARTIFPDAYRCLCAIC